MLPIPPTVPTLTLAAYAETWLALIRGTVREHTRERYRRLLQLYVLPTIGTQPLTTLSRQDVRECLAGLLARGLAPLTVRAAHAVLHALLNTALDDERVGTNVAARLARRLHRRLRERPALDVGQLNLFLATAATVTPRCYPLFVALAAGGLRVGEAIGLRAEDVDPQAPLLDIRRTIRTGGREGATKSGHARRVRVTAAAAAILRAVPEQGWLFPGRHRQKPIGHTEVSRLTRRIAETAGLPPISPKAFRRSYAVVLKAHGASLGWLAEQFGHADEGTTARSYTDGAPAPVPTILGD